MSLWYVTLIISPKRFNKINYLVVFKDWCVSVRIAWVSEWMLVAQSCPTLCDSMDCSPPGSSIHGIYQARILEWVDISFSRGSSWPRDRTWVSCVVGIFFTIWGIREAHPNYIAINEIISFFQFHISTTFKFLVCIKAKLWNEIYMWHFEIMFSYCWSLLSAAVLVTNGCITNYPKNQQLKATHIYHLSFCE